MAVIKPLVQWTTPMDFIKLSIHINYMLIHPYTIKKLFSEIPVILYMSDKLRIF